MVGARHGPAKTLTASPAPRRRRVGLLGGSFNPAHGGHRRISLFARDALGLDEVWWLVSPGNPLKDARSMAALSAATALGLAFVEISCSLSARDSRKLVGGQAKSSKMSLVSSTPIRLPTAHTSMFLLMAMRQTTPPRPPLSSASRLRTNSPVFRFHSFTVPSSELETTNLSLKARHVTALMWRFVPLKEKF